jgi:hypothetical protein
MQGMTEVGNRQRLVGSIALLSIALLKSFHSAGLDQEPIEMPGLRTSRAAVEQAIAALQYLLLF